MTIQQTYVADGIDLVVSPITFDAASGATTLIGGTCAAWARNKLGGPAIAATSAVIVSATSIRVKWAPSLLAAGKYTVHVLATPLGFAVQTVSDSDWQINASAGP